MYEYPRDFNQQTARLRGGNLMRVYMLQDVVTGSYYRGEGSLDTRWVPQSLATIWTDYRGVTAAKCYIGPTHTTNILEYTLKPCN